VLIRGRDLGASRTKLSTTGAAFGRTGMRVRKRDHIEQLVFGALRELGRLERSLFMLDWLQSVDLRRRVQAGLNKGEARNALAWAVFFNRLGEIRDRSSSSSATGRAG